MSSAEERDRDEIRAASSYAARSTLIPRPPQTEIAALDLNIDLGLGRPGDNPKLQFRPGESWG